MPRSWCSRRSDCPTTCRLDPAVAIAQAQTLGAPIIQNHHRFLTAGLVDDAPRRWRRGLVLAHDQEDEIVSSVAAGADGLMGDDVRRIVEVVERDAEGPIADQAASQPADPSPRQSPAEGLRATCAADRLGPEMPFEQMLDLCVELGIRNVEIATGGQSSAPT